MRAGESAASVDGPEGEGANFAAVDAVAGTVQGPGALDQRVREHLLASRRGIPWSYVGLGTMVLGVQLVASATDPWADAGQVLLGGVAFIGGGITWGASSANALGESSAGVDALRAQGLPARKGATWWALGGAGVLTGALVGAWAADRGSDLRSALLGFGVAPGALAWQAGVHVQHHTLLQDYTRAGLPGSSTPLSRHRPGSRSSLVLRPSRRGVVVAGTF